MIPIEPYSELLQTLYAATLDESQWPIFLGQLCQLTDSRVALFLRNDSTLGNRTIASGGIPIPEKVERQYKKEHSYTDPYRQAFMRHPRIGIIEGEDLVPHEKLVESGDYASLVLGKSLAHMTCLVLSISPRTQEIITLWRGPGRLRLDPDHHTLLDLLLPHLQNAVKIRRVLGVAQNRARNAESILDASATVSILLNGQGNILYMNRAAQELAVARRRYGGSQRPHRACRSLPAGAVRPAGRAGCRRPVGEDGWRDAHRTIFERRRVALPGHAIAAYGGARVGGARAGAGVGG